MLIHKLIPSTTWLNQWKVFLASSPPIKNQDWVIALKISRKHFKPVKEHKNTTKRFNRSRLGATVVSIVLEINKREDNEIPPHFIRKKKTKSYNVIDLKVFPLK